MMEGYYLDPVQIQVVSTTDKVNGKVCYAHSDPHMQSFDGRFFENQNQGVFRMYRNKKYNVEVQIQTDKCPNYDSRSNSPWCVRSIAARASTDVYVVNLETSEIGFRHCGDKRLSGQIEKSAGGREFKIYLPSGAEVNVQNTWETFLEVEIYPSGDDVNSADGLCGNFDEDEKNDQIPKSPDCTGNNCFRVPLDENLFKMTDFSGLQIWSSDTLFCDCSNNDPSQPLLNETMCDAQTKYHCKDDSFSKTDDICSNDRRKRDIHENIELDQDIPDEIGFDPYNLHKRQFKRSVMYKNEDDAREACAAAINTTAVQMCATVAGVDIKPYINNCALDTMISQNLEWAQIHIEAVKKQCIHYVEFNQPIPPELAAGFSSVVVNRTTDYITTATDPTTLSRHGVTTTTQPHITFDETFLTNLKDISCTNDCSNNGACVKGRCKCRQGYFGDDCSLDINTPPVLIGIPDKGRCDLSRRPCAKTSVIGRKFVESQKLTCRLSAFEVTKHYDMINKSAVLSPARLETFVEVVCPFPTPRSTRSVNDYPSDDNIARGYRVALSNNGEIFSKEDTIMIFDSTCVNCTKAGGTITCAAERGFCMQGGRCFRPGDMYGCYSCTGTPESGTEWVASNDCSQKVPSEEDQKLWIIGVTVGPSAFVVAISAAMICYCRKGSRSRQKENVSMSSLQ